jgi:hypothetical protein
MAVTQHLDISLTLDDMRFAALQEARELLH